MWNLPIWVFLAEPSSLESPSLCLQGRRSEEQGPIFYLLFFVFNVHLYCSHRTPGWIHLPRALRSSPGSCWESGPRERGFRGNKSIPDWGGERFIPEGKAEGWGLGGYEIITASERGLKEQNCTLCLYWNFCEGRKQQRIVFAFPWLSTRSISVMRICPLYTRKKRLCAAVNNMKNNIHVNK